MIHIRPMTAADIPLGMRLKREAEWNQTRADWRRFLALEPEGCLVAETEGRPVGTLIACVLGSVAWIAMVLVDARVRGRGIGTALMQHALDLLDARRVPTVRLDATPLGLPLYERLGFTPEYRLARCAGRLPSSPAVAGARRYSPAFLEALVALDAEATGACRGKLLASLLSEEGRHARLVADERGEVTGYLATRPGSGARQIGPCIAISEIAGELLLRDAWHRFAGRPVYLDVPVANLPAVRLAESAGLAIQRHLVRMYRGAKPLDHVEHLWASSGPEKG